MKPRFSGAIALLSLGLVGAVLMDGQEDEAISKRPEIDIPFEGPGRLLTLVVWGGHLTGHALIVSENGRSRWLPVQNPIHARWLSSTRILVHRELQAGAHPTELVIVDLHGQAISSLERDLPISSLERDLAHSLLHPEPSPDGLWLAGLRMTGDKNAPKHWLEVLRLGKALELVSRVEVDFSFPCWSPDGSQLAIAESRDWDGRGILYHKIVILPRDLSERRVLEMAPGEKPKNMTPLWWDEDGIYAISGAESPVVRCDPAGRKPCATVYHPGRGLLVVQMKPLGGGEAVAIVTKSFTSGVSTRWVHRLNLRSGKGSILAEIPADREDAIFGDLDWTPTSKGAAP